MGKRVLAIAALAVFAVLTLRAQVGPAAKAPELKTVLFDAASSLGMLRSAQYLDRMITQEYWATGSLTRDGQTSKVTAYRISLDYPAQGMRVDFTRTGPGGKALREIQVVAGNFAWNETEPGKGGTPAPTTVRERLVQLWTTPMGVVKAATAAGANTKVTTEGAYTVLTFPLPAPVADVTVKATFDRNSKHYIVWHQEASAKERVKTRKGPLYAPKMDLVGLYLVRVETRVGDSVTDITYGEYGDWNPEDNKSDIFVPRRILKKEGSTTWDLRTTATNTYNPYVLMWVPENVRTAK